MSCETYIKTRPLPACAETVLLGNVTVFNTDVNIYINKTNGKRTLMEVETGASGEVTLDLTDPSSGFYNEFDGLYTIQVGETYDEPLDITVGTETGKTIGISFVNISGNTETDLTLVTI